jgi:CRP-like cAMP-binding protein
MDDFTLVLITVLSAATTLAAVEYYRYLRRAKKEYKKARGAVEDVILSINRQFKRENEKMEIVAYKVEAIASKIGGAQEIARSAEKRAEDLQLKLQEEERVRISLTNRLDAIEKSTHDLTETQNSVTLKISDLEQKTTQQTRVPEPGFEAVIPIRRDKAIAQLTDTELSALEFLVSQGPKTAPEIKEQLKLSREHTARLMKKLYEEGYLERETSKIPFKYSVKKEMEKFLKKPETQAT